MFLFQCPACGQRELRSTRSLSSFTSTARGIELAIACSRCGTTVRTVTGARVAAPATPLAPSTAPAPAVGAGVAA
ncbi:MAG TPA: hypothetical protein VJM49_08575, partial [Acidimicrobiales bacterium]|nr:hypothetical protein [Acidimicrobiales bacterium]